MVIGLLLILKGIDILGCEWFGGEIYLLGCWLQYKVDFVGKCVGIIGMGLIGIQVVLVVVE